MDSAEKKSAPLRIPEHHYGKNIKYKIDWLVEVETKRREMGAMIPTVPN